MTAYRSVRCHGRRDVRMAWATGLATLLAIGCTSTADIHSIQSPSAHFEQYHTIAFDSAEGPPRVYSASPHSADVWAHAKEATAEVLTHRGYVIGAPGQADLVFRIEVGRRQTAAAPPTAQVGPSPMDPGPVGPIPTDPGKTPDYLPVGPPYHGTFDEEDRELVEGALVIDAFDGKTHALLWHGFVRAVVQPDKVDYDHLRRDVESVLASFPASGAH
jgi:hypothetical protein